MDGLFDWQLPPIVDPVERYIHSSHPWLVRKYIEKLSPYFEDHNIIQKLTEVQHHYKYEDVEKLDELIIADMLHVEQECRKNMRLPWS